MRQTNRALGFASTFIMIILVVISAVFSICATLLTSAASLHSRSIQNLKQLDLIENKVLPKYLLSEHVDTGCHKITLATMANKKERTFCSVNPSGKANSTPDYFYFQKQAVPCPKRKGRSFPMESSLYSVFSCHAERIDVSGELLALHGDVEVIELRLAESDGQPAQIYTSGNLDVQNLIVQGDAIIIAGGRISINLLSEELVPGNIFLHTASAIISLPPLINFKGKVFKQELPAKAPRLKFHAFSFTPVWEPAKENELSRE
jgi:hypothetical protein